MLAYHLDCFLIFYYVVHSPGRYFLRVFSQSVKTSSSLLLFALLNGARMLFPALFSFSIPALSALVSLSSYCLTCSSVFFLMSFSACA